MKRHAMMMLCLAPAAAVGANSALSVEVTPDGIFYLPNTGVPAVSAPIPFILDSSVIWQYSQADGLTQKTCPMGNGGEYVLTGGWYGGGRMFEGVLGNGEVFWQSEPELGENEYWTSLGTGTSAADTADRYWLARVFSVWNDNGTPGYTPDDFLVSENNLQVCLFNGASSTPLWTWEGTENFQSGAVDGPGTYDCSSDGATFALGGLMNGHLAVLVFGYESPDPLLVYENEDFTYSPRQLRLTSDGAKLVFSVGATLLRVDAVSGSLEDTYDLGASTDCFGVSADGSLVAYGFTAAKLAAWNGSEYTLSWSRNATGYYAGSAAVSDDNEVVYFGFYKSTYTSNRIYRFDPAGSTPTWIYDYPAGSGAHQDIISWMDCSADGRWLAASSWGCQTGGGDEVTVLDDMNPAAPVFSINTPGSMFHVDIAPDGSLVTAAGKHVHANVFGSGTDVCMAEVTTTGLQSGTPETLSLAAGPNPCAGTAVFELQLPSPCQVELDVFDIAGRMVSTVYSGALGTGVHSFQYSIDGANGLYLVRARAGELVAGARIMLTR